MPTSVGAGMCGQGAAQDGGAGQGDADGGDGPRPTLSTPASIQHRPFLPTSTRCALRPVSSSLRRCGPKTKAPGVGLRYGTDPQTCPVRTLRAWLDAAGIDEGPAFRHIDRQGRLFPDRISGRAAAERVTEARRAGRRVRLCPLRRPLAEGGADHLGDRGLRHRAPDDAAQPAPVRARVPLLRAGGERARRGPPGHQGRPVCRIAWPALLDYGALTDYPAPPPGRGSDGIGVGVGWQEQVVDPRVVDDAADRR
jgi:hypothetical protein